jgi:RNA polymerase-associated protein LEO1
MSDSEDPIEPIDEGGDDLFGDDDDDDVIASPKPRVLEDDELASDPEGDTYTRDRDEDDGRQQDDEVRERIIVDVKAYRHPIPKPTDGSVRGQRPSRTG